MFCTRSILHRPTHKVSTMYLLKNIAVHYSVCMCGMYASKKIKLLVCFVDFPSDKLGVICSVGQSFSQWLVYNTTLFAMMPRRVLRIQAAAAAAEFALWRADLQMRHSARDRIKAVWSTDGPVRSPVWSLVSIQTQALAFLAVFVYATHATQAIAFEWKPGLSPVRHALSRLRITVRRRRLGNRLRQHCDTMGISVECLWCDELGSSMSCCCIDIIISWLITQTCKLLNVHKHCLSFTVICCSLLFTFKPGFHYTRVDGPS